MARFAVGIGLVGLLLLTVPAVAWASAASLAQAHLELKSLHFDRALLLATQGLEEGTASPEQVAMLWAVIAEAQAALEQPQAVAEAYGRVLELNPAISLPPGASPKLRLPYEQAVARLAGERLGGTLESSFLDSTHVRTRLPIRGDVFQLAQRFELFVQSPGGFQRVPMAQTTPPEAFWVCEAPPCALYATVRDRAGNFLLELGRPEAPLLTAPAIAPAPPTARRPSYLRPTPYLVAAGVAALAAGVLTYQVVRDGARLDQLQNARAEHYFAEAQALDGARSRAYPWALAGWGAAAGMSAAAIWLW